MKKSYSMLIVLLMAVLMTIGMSAVTFAAEGDMELEISREPATLMFKPTKMVLTEDNHLLMTYDSDSYDKMYVGTAKEAVAIADPAKTALKGEGGIYDLPLGTIDGKIAIASHSVKKEGYYNRTFEIDRDAKTCLINSDSSFVPDDYSEELKDDNAVQTDFKTVVVSASSVVVEDDGTVSIVMNLSSTRNYYSRIAFIEQDKTVEEKEAVQIKGVPTGNPENDKEYRYEFSIPAEDIGKKLAFSTCRSKTAGGELEWNSFEDQHYITVNNTADVVNQMISKIQVQQNGEFTEKYIELSKKFWSELPEEEQEEDDGYFSEPTGDASEDDPLNSAPDKEKELLVVSFGTSYNDSRVATIGAIEKALAKELPHYAVRRAFTAQIIINHVQARDGEKSDNVKQAMEKAVTANVKEMVVQPTHLMSGIEYEELKTEIDKYADKIQIRYASPLLNSDSDKEAVAKAVMKAAAEDAGYASVDAAVNDETTAFVFMGHGTSHEANATYTQMQEMMTKLGYKNVFIGTVEGKPESTALPAVKAAVDAAGYKKVVLRPLMVVAGDHAHNDMAADEEGSWFYAFAYGGQYTPEDDEEHPVDIGDGLGKDNVMCQVKGLGEIKEVQDLYKAHTNQIIYPESEDINVYYDKDGETLILGMFRVMKEQTSIVAKDNGKLEFTIVNKPMTTKYNKIAFVSGDKTDDEKEAAAIEGVISEVDGKYQTAFTFEVDPEDIEKDLFISFNSTSSKGETSWGVNPSYRIVVHNTEAVQAKVAEAAALKKAAEQAVIDAEIKKVESAKISGLKAKAGKKKITVTWKKNTTFDGYKIQYKPGKTLTVKKASTVKKVIKKLKSKKTYKVRIRGYKKIDGKTYYGKWTSFKKAKVK